MWILKFFQTEDQRRNQLIRKSKSNKEWNFIILENCNCYHLVLTRFFLKSPSSGTGNQLILTGSERRIKYRVISTFIDKISSNRWMWNLKFIQRRTQSRYQSIWKSIKVHNMDRNDNVMIVGDEYGLFALNQIPITGLILILLIGQILNIILNKILDIILRTIINRTEVNQSRQDLNRCLFIIKITIKIIIFVIDKIFQKILLYLTWSSYWILVLNFSSQIYK